MDIESLVGGEAAPAAFLRCGGILTVVATALLACQPQVEVGFSRPRPVCVNCEDSGSDLDSSDVVQVTPPASTECTDCGPAVGPAASNSPEACADFEYEAREAYDSWRAQPNDLGTLAGATFIGYVEDGPDVTLVIGSDESAALTVGTPAAPPVVNEGYLCQQLGIEGLDCDLNAPIVGATYPLHGATLDGLRLRAAIPNTAPFDAWCALQQPISSGVECQFSLDAPTPYMVSNGHCKVDEQTVDCSWMLLGKAGVCSCTATECFAPGFVEGGGIDVRANDDGSELTGTFLSETVHLTRVSP